MLTEKQILLIKSSWEYINQHTDQAGIIFYNRLFELDPDLKNLFKEDLTSQTKKLIDMISFVVQRLDKFQDIVSEVKALGLRHNHYNVKSQHYVVVANALLWTLEQALTKKWTSELKEAWVTAYTVLSKSMIEAAEEK